MQTIQFKIKLEEINPSIWRRVVVPNHLSFFDLHLIIQVAMGWEDTHLYHFDYNGKHILESDKEGNLPKKSDVDCEKLFLNNAGINVGDKMMYVYDYGDSWTHTIEVEAITPIEEGSEAIPVCVSGENNCPPEDCGGPAGYKEMLRVLKDPENKQYADFIALYGDDFDPEEFDMDDVNECFIDVDWS